MFHRCCTGFDYNHLHLQSTKILYNGSRGIQVKYFDVHQLKIQYDIILIEQSSPVYPWPQLQVKELIWSTHTPPFLHGLGRQSSMSKTF